MRCATLACSALLFMASPVVAQTLSAPLSGISFLVGDWTGTGKSERGTNTGTSSIHPVVDGNALLRRDHTDVTDKTGRVVESFDQIMTIYPEGGTLHGDYLDGTHVIHYTSATILAGKSVAFQTDASISAPTFRLTYTSAAANTLGIKFEMQPPGAPAFQTIAEGTVTRK